MHHPKHYQTIAGIEALEACVMTEDRERERERERERQRERERETDRWRESKSIEKEERAEDKRQK